MPTPEPHYLVITVGTNGDIYPFMGIAKALRAMGRRVTFITNTYHLRLLKGADFPCVGMGTDEDYLSLMRNPDIWDPRKGFAALLADYAAQLSQLDAAIRSVAGDASASGPTLAIAHPFIVPGLAIAREQGHIAAFVSAYLAPTTLRTCHDPLRMGDVTVPSIMPMSWRGALWRLVDRTWIDPCVMPQINATRRALKLPEVKASFLPYLQSAPDLIVALFPSWFGPAMPDWPQPLVQDDFQLIEPESASRFTPDLTAFLAGGDKPVVFTPGTGNLHADAFFSCALKALDKLGWRGIFLTKEKSQIPARLPGTVLWQAYAPLSGLLPHVATLVHHGGIGTTAEALRAGVPQVVVPFGWDQFDNGARVESFGVGAMLRNQPWRPVRPGRLARTLQGLLDSDSVRARCAEVAAKFPSRHDPIRLCHQIEQHLHSKPRQAGGMARQQLIPEPR